MELILASASPRRSELLRRLGMDFTVVESQVAEEADPEWGPEETVKHLARDKASDVARRHPSGLVIGADTVVVLDREVLGKPSNPLEAIGMLERLSGRWHTVYTGVALVSRGGESCLVEAVSTGVRFRCLSPEEIVSYVASGEPMDKAGAYGIQELGALLVEEIKGCYFNVVGLPLPRLAEMLKQFGVYILGA